MTVRFLIDEQISHRIAVALREMARPIAASVQMPSLGRGAQDEEILPFCADNGYSLITLDRKMSTASPHTRKLIRELDVGVFFIYSGKKGRVPVPWELFKMLVRQWDEMTRIAESTRRPFQKLLKPVGSIKNFR